MCVLFVYLSTWLRIQNSKQNDLSCTFVTLCSCLSLWLVVCLCVFVLWSLSVQSVCDRLTEWVKCQSHFAFITWGTKRGALLCNLSLPAAATQLLMYLEHTCCSYREAFKHLILTLFHYNHKTFFLYICNPAVHSTVKLWVKGDKRFG